MSILIKGNSYSSFEWQSDILGEKVLILSVCRLTYWNNILKFIFLKENCIGIEILLELVPMGPTDKKTVFIPHWFGAEPISNHFHFITYFSSSKSHMASSGRNESRVYIKLEFSPAIEADVIISKQRRPVHMSQTFPGFRWPRRKQQLRLLLIIIIEGLCVISFDVRSE